MFKKRGIVANKVNLKAELEQITTVNNEGVDAPEDNRPKFSMTIEEEQTGSSNRIKGTSEFQIVEAIEKEEEQKEGVKYGYYEQNNGIPQRNSQYQQMEEEKDLPVMMEVEREEVEVIEIQEDEPKKEVVVIEDDSGNQVEILPVVQDLNGGYVDGQDDFEDEIIRKALTKQNYQQLKTNSKKQPAPESKYKRIINRISRESIMANIQKQIDKSDQKLLALKGKIDYHKSVSNTIRKKLESKTLIHDQNTAQFEQIEKVLKLIYYRASQIREFTLPGLLQQVQEEEEYIV